MDHVYEAGALGSPPSSALNTSSGYPTPGNPGGGVPATKPGAYAWYMLTEEIRNAIVGAGLTPDKTDVTQLLAAIQALAAAPGSGIELKGWREPVATPAITSNVLTINLAANNVFAFTLNANITTMTLSNVPATGKAARFELIVTADGTARTWSWFTSTVKWADGIAPTLTSTNAKKDRFLFMSEDGGSTWFGSVIGQNY
jgi:hypothetical protein